MTKFKRYILGELKTIEGECREKGISATEWVERYAERYHRQNWKGSMQSVQSVQRSASVPDNNGNRSRWANWLEWVKDR